MTPPRVRSPRRRARRGSPERPVNARIVRGAGFLVALPLLIAAFTVARPAGLPRPPLPPAFDTPTALELARDLAQAYPDRSPGSAGALGAAEWFAAQMKLYGFTTQEDSFTARVLGRGDVELRNILAVVRGDSPQAIVILAHRDSSGVGPGANANASGTAALIELARGYSTVGTGSTLRASPAHTLIFLSTDGIFGARGRAVRLRVALPGSVVAVVNPTRRRPGATAELWRRAALARRRARAFWRHACSGGWRGTAGRRPWQLSTSASRRSWRKGPFVADGIPAVTLTTCRSGAPMRSRIRASV